MKTRQEEDRNRATTIESVSQRVSAGVDEERTQIRRRDCEVMKENSPQRPSVHLDYLDGFFLMLCRYMLCMLEGSQGELSLGTMQLKQLQIDLGVLF